MSEISFVLNGENVTLTDRNPTETLLDWLRENRGLKGTKEGCNEGDCGACTLMVSEHTDEGVEHRALNACILFLPQLNGKSVTTVEGLAGPDGEMHPVQSAMVDHHASQCGFCTPGIVMSLATAHQTEAQNHDDVLAGNLCRCTGYAPIIRAAKAAAGVAPPDWMNDNEAQFTAVQPRAATTFNGGYLPTSADELAGWYLAHPDATLIGGATDVGLWVTKQLRTLNNVAFISQINDLKKIDITAKEIRIGAAVTLSRLQEVMAEHHPDFAEMIRRFGSTQVRNAATIGGNIANGSPIGDGPPALIALGATLHLRRGDERREMPLEKFFVAYGKQDRRPGEFVEAVTIPRQSDTLKCYKISKRFDQDISALCGCFNVTLDENRVTEARIAFGGMAAIPKRASNVEVALIGKPWRDETIRAAIKEFPRDFQPIDDMRASAAYRQLTASNLLLRYFAERHLDRKFTQVLEVGS